MQAPSQENAEPSNRPAGIELPERFALPSAEVLAEEKAAEQEKARANRGVDVFQTQGLEEEAYQPDFFDKAPPFMLSLMLHVVGLVVLALVVFTTRLVVQKTIAFEALFVTDEKEVEQIVSETEGVQTEIDVEREQEKHDEQSTELAEPEPEKPVPEPESAPPVIQTPEEPQKTEEMAPQVEVRPIPIGAMLKGRTPGGRAGLIGKYGGTATTEKAVELGLAWLSRQQKKDGSWSLTGPYEDGVETENQVSATAMALLAFQGAGYTTKTEKYGKNLQKGWRWLLKQQRKNGCFFNDEGTYAHHFYTHAQAAIALCELYAMTHAEAYRKPAEKAISYLVNTQTKEGGWRYLPLEDSDMSVTGWCVMALQSARMAGLDVPEETLAHVSDFLNSIELEGGTRYPYQADGPSTRTMTAEAILCRQYLGWKQNDPRMEAALDYVLEMPVSFTEHRDVYNWYYATQAMHHKGGRWWKEWNHVMCREIPANQVKRGRERGSWDPNHPTEDVYGLQAGRLYVTCLSIYILEVYYRHLPIYAGYRVKVNNEGITEGTRKAKPGASDANSDSDSSDSMESKYIRRKIDTTQEDADVQEILSEFEDLEN